MAMPIEYRHIPGFPNYRAGSDGFIWSFVKQTPRRLVNDVHSDGHSRVNLYTGSKPVKRSVHVLILTAFVGPRPNGMQACHNDGNPFNNRPENLRWDTPKANQADRRKYGTAIYVRGEDHPKAVLTQAKVDVIRSKINAKCRGVDIAREFGISQQLVCDIKNGRRWRA